MHPQVPRAMLQVYEPYVFVGYRAPEIQAACTELGLVENRMGYYGMRSAALGPVSAEVVAAVYYHHSVEMVSPAIPHAWQIASPEKIIAARFAAVDSAFRRLLPEHIDSSEMVEASELVREAVSACSTAGRAMFAAHASLPWPTTPHVSLWHGLNLFREHRADGHTVAIISSRLTPAQSAPMLIASTGESPSGRSWRWSDEDWNQAVASLQKRGWLDDDGAPTAEGLAARTRIEDETDALSLEPWEQLGPERTHRLWTFLCDLVQPLSDQNAVGQIRTPLGLSWPAEWPGN